MNEFQLNFEVFREVYRSDEVRPVVTDYLLNMFVRVLEKERLIAVSEPVVSWCDTPGQYTLQVRISVQVRAMPGTGKYLLVAVPWREQS